MNLFAGDMQEPPVVNPERSMVEAGPSESTAKKEEVNFFIIN